MVWTYIDLAIMFVSSFFSDSDNMSGGVIKYIFVFLWKFVFIIKVSGKSVYIIFCHTLAKSIFHRRTTMNMYL